MVDDVNIMRDVRLFVRILITIVVVVRYIIVCVSLSVTTFCAVPCQQKSQPLSGWLSIEIIRRFSILASSSSSPVIIKRRYWKLIVDIFRVSMEIAGKTSINTTSRRSRSWLFLLFVSPVPTAGVVREVRLWSKVFVKGEKFAFWWSR